MFVPNPTLGLSRGPCLPKSQFSIRAYMRLISILCIQISITTNITEHLILLTNTTFYIVVAFLDHPLLPKKSLVKQILVNDILRLPKGIYHSSNVS